MPKVGHSLLLKWVGAVFCPMLQFEFDFPFPFPDLIQITVAFQNSYLFEYCYKIHNVNSIGFLNSGSIHEKYITK
jgi:hypothetical protein